MEVSELKQWPVERTDIRGLAGEAWFCRDFGFYSGMLGNHWKDVSSSRVRSVLNARLIVVSTRERVETGRPVMGAKEGDVKAVR